VLRITSAISSSIFPVTYPVEVVIDPTPSNGLEVRSSIRLDQIRTLDRRRLVRRLGVVDSVTMAKVDEAIKISLGLVAI
jgi:mRNA interferase MazF